MFSLLRQDVSVGAAATASDVVTLIGIPGLDGIDGEDGLTIPGSGGSGSAMSAAQMAARVLLDAPLVSVNAGSGGLAGATGPQGTPGVAGLDGDDADVNYFQKPQVFDGELRPVTSQMLSWVSKSFETVYQAASDGLVVGISQMTAGSQASSFKGLTDGSNPPTTIRGGLAIESSNDGTAGIQSFAMPVKKNDFYEIVRTGTSGSPTETMWWVPLGTAG